MRIGIAAPIEVSSLINHLDPKFKDSKLGLGGTAINILIDGFLSLGHSVTVFTLDPRVKSHTVLYGPNLKIIFGHFRVNSRRKWVDFCYHEYKQIKKFIDAEKHNLDIVNAHWSYEFAIGTILADVTHVITFRDHSQSILKLTKHPYRFTRMLMDFWVRRKGKAFSYNSEYLRHLITLDGAVIPNPIRDSDITYSRQHPGTHSKIKICYIANGWDYRKNPEAAISAFELISTEFPNVELHLFGLGFEEKGLNHIRVSPKLKSDKVFFRGPRSHRNLMEELTHFDIMLHTAREESFGNNLIEAMAKGIPVVAGKNSGAVSWVLDSGNAGCLVDVEDFVDISDALRRLILDKDFYNNMSINGFINVRTRFSQEVVCQQYLECYNRVLNKLKGE